MDFYNEPNIQIFRHPLIQHKISHLRIKRLRKDQRKRRRESHLHPHSCSRNHLLHSCDYHQDFKRLVKIEIGAGNSAPLFCKKRHRHTKVKLFMLYFSYVKL